MTLRIVLSDATGAGLTGVFGNYLTSANSQIAAAVQAAAISASQSAASATASDASNQQSAASASASALSASNAAASASAASGSQGAAATSATNAANSAAAAAASQAAAATSETNSGISASNSGTSAANSSASATAAATSASNAAASATQATNAANAFNGEKTVATTGGTVTLSTADAANGIFKVTGALTSNVTIVFPATPHTFAVQNLTTGNYTVAVQAQGQTPTVQVVQGKSATMFTDATGAFGISAAPGVSWAANFPYSGNQALTIAHLGAVVTQTAPSTTTFPKASTFPAGSGFGFRNGYTGTGVQLALQAGDTASDLTFPYTTQPNDSMFWYSDGISNWTLGWFSNRPGTYYVPLPPLVATPAYGATSWQPTGGYSPGFEAVYLNGARLASGTDYQATDGVNINFLTFVGDGSTQLMLQRSTPVTLADVVQKSNPILGGNLTFADGTQQGTSPVGMKNRIINGTGQIQQRGSPIAAPANATTYGQCDRWQFISASSGNASTMTAVSLPDPSGLTKTFIQNITTTVPTSLTGTNNTSAFAQLIEGVNCSDLIGKQVTVSFIIRASVAGQYSVCLHDASWNYSCVQSFNLAAASTAQYVSLTFPALPSGLNLPRSNTAGLVLRIGTMNTGTYQTSSVGVWQAGINISVAGNVNWAGTINNSVAITDVQLEAGSVATAFERRPYGIELILCQRYYQIINTIIVSGYNSAASSIYTTIPYPVSMRAAPTTTLSGQVYNNSSALTVLSTNAFLVRFALIITAAGFGYCDGTNLAANAEL